MGRGMPWRTFSGYINAYSERIKILIAFQQKIRRYIEIIGKRD